MTAHAADDLAWAGQPSAGRGVLMVDHGWGGGIEAHIEDLAARLGREGVASFRAVPQHGGRALRLSNLGGESLVLPDLLLNDIQAAAATLRDLQLERVHIHSLVGLPLSVFAPLLRAVAEAGLSYDFTCHDHAPVCPRLHMVDWGGVYCDNRSVGHCAVCVRKPGAPFGPVDVSEWRCAYRSVLTGARRVFVPDQDALERLRRFFPEKIAWTVRAHPPLRSPVIPAPAAAAERKVRVVGVVGAIGPEKGSSVLLRLAGDALERRLPIEYRFYGYTDRRELSWFPNFRMMGRYTEDTIDSTLVEDPPDLIFYPAVTPETFCYALDIAFRTRLFPVCFDVGALSRRIRQAGFGAVLSLELALDPAMANNALLEIEPDVSSWREDQVFPAERRWVSTKAYYDR